MISRTIAWARSLSRYLRLRSRFEADVDEEIRTHLELRAADLMRAGHSPAEARRRARAEFGGVEKYKEEGRAARGSAFRGVMLLDAFFCDVRYACRGLLKAKGSSLIAVLAIALGIGLPTVMYSVVHGAQDMALPYEDAERIVMAVSLWPPNDLGPTFAEPDAYMTWRAQQRSFEELAAYRNEAVTLRSADYAYRYTGGVVSANTLDLLSVEPILGRGFTADDGEPGAPLAVLIGQRVWLEQFGGDPGVLGRSVTLNGESAEVIGVMEDGFGLVFPDLQDVWTPLRLDPFVIPLEPTGERGSDGDGDAQGDLWVVGKVREGVTIEQASAELANIAASSPAASDAELPVVGVRPFGEVVAMASPLPIFYAMLATVSMVLLIACANVANLLLARTAARSKDIAMRTALGASRARAISQVMTEAVVLAVVGSLFGTVLAWAGIEMVRQGLSVTTIPRWLTIELDIQVLGFIAAATVVAALISGAIPAWRGTSSDAGPILKDGSGALAGLRIGRLSRALIVAEVTMSLALLVASGQMNRSVVALARRDLPVPAEQVFTARVAPLEQHFPDAAMRRVLWEEIEREIAGIPGIRSTALATNLPGVGGPSTSFMREGDSYANEREVPRARWSVVSPAFFAIFGAVPIQGRVFDRRDALDAAPVVVVNRTFTRRFLDGEPLGRRIRVGGLESDRPWREIVGVVPDLYMAGMANTVDAAEAGFYVPLAQEDATSPYLVVTAGGAPLDVTNAVRAAVSAADVETPIYSVSTLRSLIDNDNDNTGLRVFGVLFGVFGIAALFMAATGLYAVVSFNVTRRVPELGLRMAVGASAGQVRRLVLSQGMRTIAIGAVLGSGLAGFVVTALSPVILGVSPWSPMTYAPAFAVLTVTGLAACAVPARRATRVDPMTALRSS